MRLRIISNTTEYQAPSENSNLRYCRILAVMFIVPMRYHRFYPLRPEPITNSWCTVTFVADPLPRLASPTMPT